MDRTVERTDSVAARATARLHQLVRCAQAGDHSVLPELRETLDANPDIWQRYGDLAGQAQRAWLQLLAGQDLALHECVERRLAELRAELSGPEPSPPERLLVERVVACWLQCHYADWLYAHNTEQQATPAVLRELLKRQESSQRRYLAAIKQLAVVRKLLRPTPSTLELLTRTVPETEIGKSTRNARSGSPAAGVPVLN